MANWDEAPIVEATPAVPVQDTSAVVDPAVAAPVAVPEAIPATPTGASWDAAPVVEDVQTPENTPLSPMDNPDAMAQRPMSELKLGNPEDDKFNTIKTGVEQNIVNNSIMDSPDSVVGPDVYDAIDARYPLAKKWEEEYSGHAEPRLGGPLYGHNIEDAPEEYFSGKDGAPFKPGDREKIIDEIKNRENEKALLYQKVGKQVSDPTFLEKAFYWGDFPIRRQSRDEPNIDFDPTKKEDPVTNPRTKSVDYIVPPPDQLAIGAIGYQIARNTAGLFDTLLFSPGKDIAEGKAPGLHITDEGPVRESMPQIPMKAADKFVADATSYVLGPTAVMKTLKGVGEASKLAGVGLASRFASYLSPEAVALAKKTYDSTLKVAGQQKALQAAQKVVSGAAVGLTIGLSEGAIAEDDSSGGIVSPEFIQRHSDMSARSAHDLSVMLDTPILNGTLSALGKAWTGGRSVAENSLGGLRNTRMSGIIKASKKEAGAKALLTIDPRIFEGGPEKALEKIKILSDNLMQESHSDLVLGTAKTTMDHDTTTAFMRSATRYFRQSYAYLEDQMGPAEFSKFVTKEATDATTRLVGLKTAMAKNPAIEAKAGADKVQMTDLYDTAAKGEISGDPETKNLFNARAQASNILARDRTVTETALQKVVDKAGTEAQTAKTKFENSFTSDPDIHKVLLEARDQFALGTHAPINAKSAEIVEKAYQGYKKSYSDVQTAYKKVAEESGATADQVAFLEKVKSLRGEEGFQDPIFQKVADAVNENDSYANMVTHVHNMINDRLKDLTKGTRDVELIQKLRDLDNHIFEEQPKLITTGAPKVLSKLKDATNQYATFKSAWGDLPEIEEMAAKFRDRFNANDRTSIDGGAKLLPKGVTPEGQNVSAARQTASDMMEKRRMDPSQQFNPSLERAAKLGGQDIAADTRELAELRLKRDMSAHFETGKQDLPGLRASVRQNIDELERVGSPLVPKLRKLENDIRVMEKDATNKGEAYTKIQQKYAEIKGDLETHAAAKFVQKVNGEKNLYEAVGDPQSVMDTVFRAKNSTNQVRELVKKAKTMENGDQVIEALRGSYLQWLKNQTFGNIRTGIGRVDDMGATRTKNISERGISNILERDGVKANVEELFGKETYEQVQKVTQAIDDATLTFDRGTIGNMSIKSADDPAKAATTLITMMFGVLNPRATMAKRLANPYGEMKLGQLKDMKEAAIAATLVDPKKAIEFMKILPTQQINQKQMDAMRYWLIRGGLQTDTENWWDDYLNPFQKTKNRDFKVPEGVKMRKADAGPTGPFKDQTDQGNIDLAKRPKVTLPDGSTATVRSMSFEEDGKEVLVPTISPDGKELSNRQAIELYRKTGQHLGKFKTPEAADAYAEQLHNAQENYYLKQK